jgi:alpha-L-rhamnosidase
MSPDTSPPLRIIESLPVKRVTQPAPKVYIVDFGQIYAGYMRLKVHGPAGHTIVVRYGEILNPDGSLHTINLRAARNTDTFTLDGSEQWIEPSFTYKGFRYVEITGLQHAPKPEQIDGVVMHVDAPLTGEFKSSHKLLNQLWKNIRWGQRGNFLSVPTDCPQRDERLGWTGDMQIYVRTGVYQMDSAAYLTKWMRDVRDGQHASGAFPDVAPRIVVEAEGAPAWGDCGVVVPWTLWRMYGDTAFISENWEAMERWMAFLRETNPNLRRLNRRGNDYGDWVAMDSATARDLIGTAYWAHDATLMAQMAAAVGNTAAVATYTQLAADVRAAFNTAHVAESGAIVGDITNIHPHLVHLNMPLTAETQTNYTLALNLDLLPETLIPLATDRLKREIARRGMHLSTGFVGTMHLLPALTKGGANDYAYRLLLQEAFPSWLYPVTQGATTMWERWDSYHHEFGLQTPTMNSFNHFAYGCVGDWMMRVMVGICDHPDKPGFQTALIAPQPGGDIRTVSGHYDSQFGRYKSSWSHKGSHFTLTVTVPPGCEADVTVPTSEPKSVRHAGKKQGSTTIRVGAGTHEFTSVLA